MELETFITETIKSIINGVTKANEFAKENGAMVNPLSGSHDSVSETRMFNETENRWNTVTKVDFDVAVTASNEENTKIGGGLKIQVLNMGASAANNITSQTSSRIKFDVNITLPHQPKY